MIATIRAIANQDADPHNPANAMAQARGRFPVSANLIPAHYER